MRESKKIRVAVNGLGVRGKRVAGLVRLTSLWTARLNVSPAKNIDGYPRWGLRRKGLLADGFT